MINHILSPAAQADIDHIWDYTADTWSIPQADRYIAKIRQACSTLSSNRSKWRKIAEVRNGYFKLSVGSHFVVFRLVDGVFDIVRVLHQRMDIQSHIQE